MTINITAKCSDMFSASLVGNNGVQVGEYDGYVPSWFPNSKVEHYGDYVELTIDVETGKIMNWQKPSDKNLSKDFDCVI
jgi:hypothetical protein